MSNDHQATVDTVVIGGGVAALWTANVLKKSGQSVLVLTNSPLGSGQSLSAQGVIHGGLKYAVGGKLTDSSEALADMPARWLAALRGEGPVDLSEAKLLCDHQILWSLPNVVSQIVGFFGSKAVRGRSAALSREEFPPVFATDEYRGKLFRVEEPVVDPVSTLHQLAKGVAEETYLVDWSDTANLDIQDGCISGIDLLGADGSRIRLKADCYLLAAGAGNEAVLEKLGIETPQMQVRPLHQVIIRKEGLPDFFSVCVGTGPKPPIVVTTHRDTAGRTVWYVGGDLAEAEGVARSEGDQITEAQTRFAKLLPWVDLTGAEWFTHRIDRAEPLTGTGDRPPGAYLERVGNVLVAWPTKLALAPDLADKVLAETKTHGTAVRIDLPLPHPAMGLPPWEKP